MEKKLSPAELERIETFKNEVSFERPEEILQFGLGVQKNLSRLSEEILGQVKNRDAGDVGILLSDMMSTLKGFDVEGSLRPGPISKIWQRLLKETSLFKGGFETVEAQLEKFAAQLEADKEHLLEANRSFDLTYEQNLAYYNDLNLLILAGEEVLQLKLRELGEGLASTEDGGADFSQIQRQRDARSALQQFEKRLHDLRLTRTMTLQTLPQIRLLQHNNSELVNKIQSSILNVIPIWKNQIVLTLGLQKQKQSVQVQKKIFETTNELLSRNSEILKDNTLEVAKLSEQGILDAGTLKKVNQDLIETIGGALETFEEGRRERQRVEGELQDMETKLKAALSGVTRPGA